MAEHEPMVEVFIYETRDFLARLEELALKSEEAQSFAEDDVNEIFRAMHTIKGSAAMMMLDDISKLAHAIEDIFFYIRELHPKKIDVSSVTDFVLAAVDFMQNEINVLDDGGKPSESSQGMRDASEAFLRQMKIDNGDDPDVDLRKVKGASSSSAKKESGGAAAPSPAPVPEPPPQYYIGAAKQEEKTDDGSLHVYEAVLNFDPGSGMLEVRAYTVVNSFQGEVKEMHYLPDKLLEDPEAADKIEKNGLRLYMTADQPLGEIKKKLEKTSFLVGLNVRELKSTDECSIWPTRADVAKAAAEESEPIVPKVPEVDGAKSVPPAVKASTEKAAGPAQRKEHESQVISVKVEKLDRLMDLVGELVIAESMVVQNPDLKGLEIENFEKAARQLHKINGELQDSVMSLRMVPLEGTFKKMNRIVRDMTKKLGKKAHLLFKGESTEVDKTINDHIGDPLMHIIRNSIDHGIEMPADRVAAGKPETGTVTLAAMNSGGEVILRIMDDGAGLDRDKILSRARERHLLTKPEAEYTDQEIYHFIFAAGFSTNDNVTEFSGRGVGMDVVVSNIKSLGGSVSMDSDPGKGSTTTIRIPLTLAIIEGMSVGVGSARFTVPISAIRRSIRPKPGEVFKDTDGREMIMEDGECCPVVRLDKIYGIKDAEQDINRGILMLLESRGGGLFALHADELMGVQEIVVKPVPKYISYLADKTGISGCTLLGDGSISLILDAQILGSILK